VTTPRELLAAAIALSGHGHLEADWRASISRAYYAAFHALTLWHATLPMPGSVGSARNEHEQLVQRLCHPDKACSKAQADLSRWCSGVLYSLRALRVIADYKLETPVTLGQARFACESAKDLLDRIKSR
jgi:uncharacterized protein (UPF0332 family)